MIFFSTIFLSQATEFCRHLKNKDSRLEELEVGLFFQQAMYYVILWPAFTIYSIITVYDIQILHFSFKGEHEKELFPWYWACRSFSQVCFHLSSQGSKFKLLKEITSKEIDKLWIKTCFKGSLLPQKPESEFLLSERRPDARALHCPCQGGLHGRP